jgi:hypothetical protein
MIFTEETRKIHNEKQRLKAYDRYHENHEVMRAISSLKYYRRKYKDDENVLQILNEKDMSAIEKLKNIKKYNFNKRF